MSTPKTYIIGFILSIVLTLGSYYLVTFHLASGHTLPSDQIMTFLLPGLAIIQAMVQLLFFLHLRGRSGWDLAVFLSTVSVILILVVGSLWIMGNLNYNMMPDSYIIRQEGMQ